MGVIDGKTDREMDWKHHSLSNVTIAELLIVLMSMLETQSERERQREREKENAID